MITLDITPLQDISSGVGVYTRGLLTGLMQILDKDSLSLCYQGEGLKGLSREEEERLTYSTRLPAYLLYKWWNRFNHPCLDSFLKGTKVYHNPNFYVPPTRKIKTITTVHDLAFLHFKETASRRIVSIYEDRYKTIWERSDAIITPSIFTRDDLLNLLPSLEGRVYPIYFGIDAFFKPLDKEMARKEVEKRFAIKGDFILHVGTIEIRKGHKTLFEAIKILKDKAPLTVCAGKQGWGSREIISMPSRLGIEDKVVFLGALGREDIRLLYNTADIFVFPSLHEGFGMPVLEACACGCPVIASRNSSIPEIGGNAIQLFDTSDSKGLAESIQYLLDNEDIRQEISQLGQERAGSFTWKRNAEEHCKVYNLLKG